MERTGLALAALALAACAYGPRPYLKPGYSPPPSLAVLPLRNETLSLDGPDVVRYWLDQRLAEKKGYPTLPLERVDEALRSLGVTDGGQLGSVEPRDLGAALGVRALVYGDLLDFDYRTTGLLNVRKVRVRVRMVDAATGERLWEAEGTGAESSGGLGGGAALKAALTHVGTQWAEKAAQSPLRTETWDAVWNAIESLPER